MPIRHPTLWLSIPRRNQLRRLVGRPPEEDFLSAFERQHRCIFFHLPKTAGITISETILGGFHTNHRIYRRCAKADPVSVAKFWKFCILRDPVDRFISAYRFLAAGGISPQDRIFQEANAAAFASFERFLQVFQDDPVLHNYVHFRPQAAFVCDDQGRLRMDFVGRFENLPEAFDLICSQLGITARLRSHNRTPDHAGRPELTPEANAALRTFYAADYAILERLM